LTRRAGRLDAVDAGHGRVQQDHVRCELAGEGDGLLAVGRGPDDFDAVDPGQRGDQAVAEEQVIVGDDDPQYLPVVAAGCQLAEKTSNYLILAYG
jgi:hypothetical protein